MATVHLKECHRIEWKIEDPANMIRMESKEFVLDSRRWMLMWAYDNYIEVSLYVTGVIPCRQYNPYTIQGFIEDVDKNPVQISARGLSSDPLTPHKVWRISRQQLQKQRDRWLTDGTLTIVILFTLIGSSQRDEISKTVSKSIQTSETAACLKSLSLDLQHLKDGGIQSDVTLICEEHSFPAHKGILSARSEVFAAMFRSGMAESRSGVIEITDMDAHILDLFLQYVYTGKLSDLSVVIAPKLYEAADKYSMELLKKLCANFMKENLTKESACKILVLADTHNDEDLKDCVLHFIVKRELLRDKMV